MTTIVNNGVRALKLLASWLSLPFTAGGRLVLQWQVERGVLEAANSSLSLPQLSWSQDGEDLLFVELFPKKGFYIDVGANHPDRFSVTKSLYELGWHGVNIDASPNFQELFDSRRPRDTNIESLVGSPRVEHFFEFEESTLSTLNASRAQQLIDLGWKLRQKREVHVRELNTVLLDHVPSDTTIDLLSLDVEGEELNVLTGLAWDQWDIQRCLVEIVQPAYLVASHPVAQVLIDHGFKLTRVWGRSCLFERDFQADELDRSTH